MLTILGQILTVLAPIILLFVKVFVRDKEAKAKAVKNYYEFLNQIDKKSENKTKNYIEAEDALEKIQRQIRERQLQEPHRPTVLESLKEYDTPSIVELETEVKTQGKYLTKSKKARGLVIHYTAGCFNKGMSSANNTLSDLAKKGLGCLVMDYYGTIYRAKNQAIDDIAWHAGESEWLGHVGLSRYCIGLEICNSGLLEASGHSWFGQKIPEEEQRKIEHDADNQKAGMYHKFTAAQEKSLINFVRWQLDTNPEFDIDWIMGHDECSPGRKNDPGGALSMTMPQFRDMIRSMR